MSEACPPAAVRCRFGGFTGVGDGSSALRCRFRVKEETHDGDAASITTPRFVRFKNFSSSDSQPLVSGLTFGGSSGIPRSLLQRDKSRSRNLTNLVRQAGRLTKLFLDRLSHCNVSQQSRVMRKSQSDKLHPPISNSSRLGSDSEQPSTFKILVFVGNLTSFEHSPRSRTNKFCNP